jgi:hypothetical protein
MTTASSASVKHNQSATRVGQIHDAELNTIPRAAMTAIHVAECSRDALLRGRL